VIKRYEWPEDSSLTVPWGLHSKVAHVEREWDMRNQYGPAMHIAYSFPSAEALANTDDFTKSTIFWDHIKVTFRCAENDDFFTGSHVGSTETIYGGHHNTWHVYKADS
jgi:hypothetical protein